MKSRLFKLFISSFLLLSGITLTQAAPVPYPQYSSNNNSERTVTGYYYENGKIKNLTLKIKNRNLKAYWDGREWINKNGKIEKNKLSDDLKDDDSETTIFLSKFPRYVMIDNVKVFFDPEE